MAWGFVAQRGGISAKAAGATLTEVASANIVTDRLVVVLAGWDNSDADGLSTRLTASDESGNTWTRAVERTESPGGAAADGTIAGIYYAVTSAQIDSGDDIIVTDSDSARVAKALIVYEFSKDSGSTVEVVDVGDGGGPVGAQSASVTGLDSGDEHLLVAAMVHERGDVVTSFTSEDGDYTIVGGEETSGGGANTNICLQGAYRIASGLTGDTYSVTTVGTGDGAVVLAAFREVTGGGGTPQELDAAGTTVSDGAAVLTVVRGLAAAGLTLSSGNAALTVVRGLAAAATTSSAGNAALTVVRGLAAAATTLSNGAANVTIALPMIAAGLTRSAGSAVLAVTQKLAAAATTSSTGAAVLTVMRELAASGLTRSAGNAVMLVPKRLAAAATTLTSGRGRLAVGGAIATARQWMHVRLGIGTGP